MAVSAKFDSFNVTLDVATTTHAHTGYGFAPACVLPMICGRTESVNTAGAQNHKRAIGGGVSTSARGFIATQSENGVTTSNCDEAARNDSLIGDILIAGTWGGYLDINSMDSGGWTDIVDLQFTFNERCHLLALGNEITCQQIVISEPTVTGSQNYAVTGTPSAIYIVSSPGGITPGTIVPDSRYMVGVAVNAAGTIKNAILAGGSNDAQATMQTRVYCRMGSSGDNECIAGVASDFSGINSRARCTAMTLNQFTLDWLEVIGDGTRDYYIVVVYGGLHDIQQYMTQTDTTTDITLSGLTGGMLPVAGMTFSGDLSAFSSSDVLDLKDEWMQGMFAWNTGGTLEQGGMALRDDTAVATSNVGTAIRFDGVHANLSPTNTIDGVMSVISRVAGSLTLRMTDADPISRIGWAWVIGTQADDMPAAINIQTVNALGVTKFGLGVGRIN